VSTVRRVAALVLLVMAAATGAGCGLSTNDEPETIKDNVPPDLLDTETATPETPAGGSTETETVNVWFLRTDNEGETRVTRRPRLVPRPATQIQVLETLIKEPPVEMERLGGIFTAIPEDVTVTEQPERRSDGVLIVSLSDDFYDLQGETARNAFAQIVFTASELPGITAVQFQRDGEVFYAVDGQGQSSRAPLSPGSFGNMLPENDETTESIPGDDATTGTGIGPGVSPTDEA
jgi:spore germination protein GerM